MSGFFSQSRFDVRLEWGIQAVELMAQDVDCVVIVDVMSFATCVSVALSRGAVVYPYPWKDDRVQQYAETFGAVVANANRRFAGEGYFLSPASLAALNPGTKLVLPSPNGSALAFKARESGAVVYAGCLRNLTATADACNGYKKILIVAGGEKWPDGSLRPALEDWVVAGGIASLFSGKTLSPEALAAAACYRTLPINILFECSSARELIERGFAKDVELCLTLDAEKDASRLQDNYFIYTDRAAAALSATKEPVFTAPARR
ncbi:2-phosphosulfolactate phosphatase [Serratia marcescens]|uniref:2-phosphosulfolactate phosphatase n=1 Tax=Serratia marcescens TaxID=615 RepID=UPI001570C5EA|nr:2-phosphosulfolactate phosphatase [Serratia marcescens]MBN5309657.1 2-phosphosulfolactate phosphatase [Serratia marcescens]NSL13632.1 2-phosphosulfolactate phosphatase [Serratia marcescens]